jgi:hypothetical protein
MSRGSTEEVKLILSLPSKLKPKYAYSLALPILGLIDRELGRLISTNMQDLKTFVQICWLINNIVVSSDELAEEVISYTLFVKSCYQVITLHDNIDPEVYEKIFWVIP